LNILAEGEIVRRFTPVGDNEKPPASIVPLNKVASESCNNTYLLSDKIIKI